ncbi:MAG: phosphatidate cytidylyltransferase [Bacteroidales bacterium]
MIETFALIIPAYFLAGGILMAIINRKKDPGQRKTNILKYLTYFLIVSILFFSILINPFIFRIVALMIIVIGFFEVFLAAGKGGSAGRTLLSIVLFGVPAILFLFFSTLDQMILLITVFVITIFDAFSQLTGQLIGKRKLFPSVSPGKTVEGLLGGIIVSSLSTLLIMDFTGYSPLKSLMLGLVIAGSGFAGDMLESAGKRKLGIKDFGRVLPGHGGILDRFDSLILAGAIIFLFIKTGLI